MLICNSTEEKTSPQLDTNMGKVYATKEGKETDNEQKKKSRTEVRVRCRRSHPVSVYEQKTPPMDVLHEMKKK